jgi:Protein of unknown function (DUF3025)
LNTAIDWTAPWLKPWRELGAAVEADASRVGLPEALNTRAAVLPQLRAGLLHFVDPCALPRGEAYEAFIDRTANVPTRSNHHDFFNGLAWLRHPTLKRRLNELQADEIERQGPGAGRGSLRDALTLFDENAAILQAPSVLTDALRARNWEALFITHRAAWAEARFELFGHALLEKLLQPRKAMTAHVWCLDASETFDARAIDTLADAVRTGRGAVKPFLPLPVLGVPGWWPENEDPSFYADAGVFRRPP